MVYDISDLNDTHSIYLISILVLTYLLLKTNEANYIENAIDKDV